VKLENSFEVPAPPEQAWGLLMDVPRTIPCMPGAQLDETVDDRHWKATMAVKLGPISLSFKTDLEQREVDEAARRVTLAAKAREARGRGNAAATIQSSLTPQDYGTRVDIVTDLQLTGAVAQYGRGLVADVSSQLVGQFADCLKKQLAASPEEAEAAVAAQSRPVGGVRLGLSALWRSLVRLVRREKPDRKSP
jgi:carbon monoxide dehydrogenase subunit G